jgi:hypothetical protein
VVAVGEYPTAGSVKDSVPAVTTVVTPATCSKVTADGKTPENISKSRSKTITVSNSSSQAAVCSKPLQQEGPTSVSSPLSVSQSTSATSINVTQNEDIVSTKWCIIIHSCGHTHNSGGSSHGH